MKSILSTHYLFFLLFKLLYYAKSFPFQIFTMNLAWTLFILSYPSHYSYLILAPAAMQNEKDIKKAAGICLDTVGLDPELYRLGHTKARFNISSFFCDIFPPTRTLTDLLNHKRFFFLPQRWKTSKKPLWKMSFNVTAWPKTPFEWACPKTDTPTIYLKKWTEPIFKCDIFFELTSTSHNRHIKSPEYT